MNPVLYEQIMSMLGLIALWAFWYHLRKPQRVDLLRQKLFALRTDLFDLGANGAVSFDHPAYTGLRLLINGIIRFAHRATFPALLVAALHSEDAPSGALAAWKKSAENLPEPSRSQILAIHARASEALVRHMIGGSIVLSGYMVCRFAYSIARLPFLLFLRRTDLSYFTVARARIKIDREKTQVVQTATVIEARVLHEEQQRIRLEGRRRSEVDREHVYAH